MRTRSRRHDATMLCSHTPRALPLRNPHSFPLFFTLHPRSEFEAGFGESGLFSPPSFVDKFYCDSTVQKGLSYGGPWKEKMMFADASSICVNGELKSEGWWADRGLEVGGFKKDLDYLTDQPLELRLMHGRDTLYEGIAVRKVKLEVCACPTKGWDGKPISHKECLDRCNGATGPLDVVPFIGAGVGALVLAGIVYFIWSTVSARSEGRTEQHTYVNRGGRRVNKSMHMYANIGTPISTGSDRATQSDRLNDGGSK